MPKISIIVPVYNTEKYLRACLDSILAQTYTDWECILVDDGSTDESGLICDEYASKDNRFVVVHKKNEGVAKARITAFEHCKGELITFIDADDYVTQDYLEKLAKPILEDDADMVSCNHYDVNIINRVEKACKKTLHGFFRDDSLQDFISKHYFYDNTCKGFGMTPFLCTKMVRRDFVKVGLQDGIGMWFGEDQIAMFSMLYKIEKLCIIPDRLYYYVHYEGQATRRYDYSLWKSLIRMFESYQRLDTSNIAHEGLHIRTWMYIQRTIQQKMFPSGVDLGCFIRHMTEVRQHPYMRDFFKASTTGFGWKEDVKYWLLKLGWFRIFYYCLAPDGLNYLKKAKYTISRSI